MFEKADFASAKIGNLKPTDEFETKDYTILGCSGTYAQIEGMQDSGAPIRGWITYVCSDQYAMCATPMHGASAP